MSRSLTHRGPDSGGQLALGRGRAHVGFRRLAIRDLDARANQPMVSASGRTAIVFNGEVYNSAALAERYLGQHQLRTTGDTEVILELLEQRGTEVVPELNGMFALAWVDVATGRMTLIRDRMGKKPLYLYESPQGVTAFASELRALKPFGLRVDPANIGLFLHFGYFPSPYTHYQQTTQVRPGEIVELHQGRVETRRRFHRFVDEAWCQGGIDEEALSERLREAVMLRTLSDVPLGTFLSGGVDSAIVAAQLSSAEPIPPAFTVEFQDESHNEADDAAITAAELGVPHQVISIEERELPTLVTDYMDCYEQPYADTSGLVTLLLCEAVKKHVTVAISGDGGDEFFGGYTRYQWFRQALRLQALPDNVRRHMGVLARRLGRRRGHRIENWLQARDPAELYCAILCNWTYEKPLLVPDVDSSNSPLALVADVFRDTGGDALARAACFDATYYIPDDLQVKLDRASMRVALEVRCPLLDANVARLGAECHTRLKYRQGPKSVLKRYLAKYVSPAVLRRRKHGFSVPLRRWLRGPLRDLMQDRMKQRGLRESGWLDVEVAEHVWQRFLQGQGENAHMIWLLSCLCHHATDEVADEEYKRLLESTRRAAA